MNEAGTKERERSGREDAGRRAEVESEGKGDKAETEEENEGVLDVDDALAKDADNGSKTDAVNTTGEDDITGGAEREIVTVSFASRGRHSGTGSDWS